MNAGATCLGYYDDAGALAADLVVVRQISQEANLAIFSIPLSLDKVLAGLELRCSHLLPSVGVTNSDIHTVCM